MKQTKNQIKIFEGTIQRNPKYKARFEKYLELNRKQLAEYQTCLNSIDAASEINTVETEVIPIKSEVPNNPKIAKMITNLYEKIYDEGQTVWQRLAKEEQATASIASENPYIGSSVCRQCHSAQYLFWKRTKHARAMPTLVNLKQQFNLECIGCHTTGYQKAPDFFTSLRKNKKKYMDVCCETCHGPASGHPLEGKPNKHVPKSNCMVCHTANEDPQFDYELGLPKVACPKNKVR